MTIEFMKPPSGHCSHLDDLPGLLQMAPIHHYAKPTEAIDPHGQHLSVGQRSPTCWEYSPGLYNHIMLHITIGGQGTNLNIT